ncbi:MAG TPA: hypothetical protein VER12_19810 [Polyangiaceae bacterium]|nr:hypothetical protein [Polyangiaceae bacterium]
MIRKITGYSLLATALLGLFPLACQPGGVGDPCTPEDEYGRKFSGYASTEVNVESKSFQCETRVCLANHFQGRVSCRYGQEAPAADGTGATCHVPGDPSKPILVKVDPQLVERQADRAVYCSCRCDGEDKNARYCKCPSGYACSHIKDDINLGAGQLAGSYCVRDGTAYTGSEVAKCDAATQNCGTDTGT